MLRDHLSPCPPPPPGAFRAICIAGVVWTAAYGLLCFATLPAPVTPTPIFQIHLER